MGTSLFDVLKAEGLSSLRLRYNFRKDSFSFFAGRQWDENLDFSRYNKDFFVQDIMPEDGVYLGTEQVKEIFSKHDTAKYFQSVLELIRQGRHLGIDMMFHAGKNIRLICGIHSVVRGINNKSHALMTGATRRRNLEDPEIDVIKDALNLSRAMSFKNIAADIPFGGCKTAVHMAPLDVSDMESMGFLAFCCDSTRCTTGPDMNMPKEMVKVMNDNFTMQYSGGTGSPLGDTAVPTAYGAYLALRQAVKFRTGNDSLDGMSVAVQGLGAVGYNMAHNLSGDKVKLHVTDLNTARVEQFIREHPDCDVTAVALDEILKVDADILCPCAMGGVLGEEEIMDIKFKYVFGPANNQLRATSQDEEIKLAKLMDERGILFQTEWWHNCAGVLAAVEEYEHGTEITYRDLEKKVEQIVPSQTWKNLNRAKELGITPTECAYSDCQNLIYGGRN